ncbi:MAG: hypothetical protein KH436_00125 [Firmicutes bacterium]|jgi:membrane protein|nr:hypothetical protein [Bacillota bacterium]
MKHKLWLSPKFIGEGIAAFFFQLHRILLYSFYALLCSLPVLTAGGAYLALFGQIRRIAEEEKTSSRDYFAAFRRYAAGGIPYGLALAVLILGLSVPAPGGIWGFFQVIGCFLLFTALIFYPPVYVAGYRGGGAFARAVGYAASHAGETMVILGLAVILLFAALLLSEVLLVLFYPLVFFVTARAVVANNKEEFMEEETSYEKTA